MATHWATQHTLYKCKTEKPGNQTFEFEKDFPVDDRLYGNLKKCGKYTFGGEILTNNLQPSDIQIYAEIGHLTTFCTKNFILPGLYNETFELNDVVGEFSSMCLQSMESDSKQPSLSKILRILSPNFHVIESKQRHKSLQVWTKHVVHQIHKIDRFLEKWKLIILAPGLYDLESGESGHRVVHDVLQSLQIIHHRLPEKTFVIIIRNAKRTFWKSLAKNFIFCEKILSLWPNHEGKSDEVWNVLEERVKKNYRSETFYVDVVPFMENSVPLKHGKTIDISVVSPDCVHLSSRGLSLVHLHLWNYLVQPTHQQTSWVPLVRPMYCPRPSCPYIVTDTNMWFCPQAKQKDPQMRHEKDLSDLLILGLLIATIALYVVLLLYMMCT